MVYLFLEILINLSIGNILVWTVYAVFYCVNIINALELYIYYNIHELG